MMNTSNTSNTSINTSNISNQLTTHQIAKLFVPLARPAAPHGSATCLDYLAHIDQPVC